MEIKLTKTNFIKMEYKISRLDRVKGYTFAIPNPQGPIVKLGMTKEGSKWVTYELTSGVRLGQFDWMADLTNRAKCLEDAILKVQKHAHQFEQAIKMECKKRKDLEQYLNNK